MIHSSFWVSDAAASQCEECNEGFSLLNRRHHCRHCGNVFCSPCTNYALWLRPVMPVSKRGRSTGEGNTEEDHLIHLEATSRKRRLPIPNHNDVGPVAFYFVANQHISVNRSWQSQSAGTALIEGNFWFKCRVCTWCYSACRQGIERDEPARLFSRLCGEEDRLNSIPPTESPWNFFGHLLFSSQATNSSRAPSTAGQSATDAQNSSSNSTTKNSVMVSPIITGAGGDEPPRSPLRKVQLDIAARKERKIGLILLDERRLKVDENECVGDTPNALNSSVSPILEDTSDEHHLGPFPTTERSVSSCYDVITALLDERHGKRRKDDMWGVVSPTSPPVSGTRRGSGSFRAAAAKRSDSAPNVRASSYIVRDASFSLESSFHAYTPAALNPQPARSSSRDHILSTSVVKGCEMKQRVRVTIPMQRFAQKIEEMQYLGRSGGTSDAGSPHDGTTKATPKLSLAQSPIATPKTAQQFPSLLALPRRSMRTKKADTGAATATGSPGVNNNNHNRQFSVPEEDGQVVSYVKIVAVPCCLRQCQTVHSRGNNDSYRGSPSSEFPAFPQRQNSSTYRANIRSNNTTNNLNHSNGRGASPQGAGDVLSPLKSRKHDKRALLASVADQIKKMSISVEGYVIVVLRDANADLTRKVDNDSNPQSPLSSSVSSVFTSSAVSPNTAHVSPGTRFPRGGKKEKPKDTAAQESLSRTDLQYVLGKMTGSGCGNTPVTVVEVVDENNFRHCKDRETLSDASLLSDTCREMGAAYALKKYSDVQTSGKHTRSSSSGSSSNNSRDNSCNTNSDVDHSINDSRTGGETYPHAFLLQGLEMLMTTVLLQSVKET